MSELSTIAHKTPFTDCVIPKKSSTAVNNEVLLQLR